MSKPQTQATITTKTKTKIYSKAPTKKRGSTKTQTVRHAHKRKPEVDPTDSDERSSPEPSHVPQKKRTKQSVDNEMDTVDDEPELVIDLVSGGGRDDAISSSDESEGDGLEVQHRITIPMELPTKKGLANDLRLIFTDSVTVKFVQNDRTSLLEKGRWCTPCRDNAAFVQKEGKRKAFHTGSNSSCRVHIRQHYELYQRKCKEANIPEHHWAVPRSIWNEREALRKHGKVQATLDSAVTKLVGPQAFTRKNLLHMVTQFVTIDDQSLGVADKATFRNCLVAMRPKSTLSDLPSTHDVVSHLHNEFVRWMGELEAEINVAPGLVSITADSWTVDTTKAGFLGVTAHWIGIKAGEWKLRTEVIGFQSISGDHSGVNLGRYIMGVFDRVGIMGKNHSKLLTATLDNASNNTTLCETVEDIHLQRNLNHWWADENQLPCLGHVINLANVAVMDRITKIAAVETTTAIWEYDPSLPTNRVLNGSLDVVAAVRTLAIKIQSSSQRIEAFKALQLESGLVNTLSIPLHSNVRWGTACRMLSVAYRLRRSINLFVSSADHRYGPITTIRREGRVIKHIPWSAFIFSERDWERVKEAAEILDDSNGIQQYFSAEKRPTLWRALPAIEELQTAWEAKRDDPRFSAYRTAIDDGLAKLGKYYSRFDEKPAYVIALALHPYFKLAYIEIAWGGPAEQEAERRAGNPHAKDWQDEARKILERTVERYSKRQLNTKPMPTQAAPTNNNSILSDFDRHRLTLLSGQEGEGWQAELHQYLKDMPTNVTKDTDVVEWWQNNGHHYPTLRCIAIDFLACPASSVPCERLFSGGGEIATKRRAQLGAARFEELLVMKFSWRNNIGDLAAWNSSQVEEVDDKLGEYRDLLAADGDQATWDA